MSPNSSPNLVITKFVTKFITKFVTKYLGDLYVKIAPGSTTSIIVPLTTIGNQLKDLCDKHGVTAVLSSEVWIRVPSKNDVSLLDKNTLSRQPLHVTIYTVPIRTSSSGERALLESTNYKCCVSVCQLYQVRMAGNTNVFHK